MSVAPLAAFPIVAGGMVTTGITVLGVTLGGGTLLVAPAVALAVGAAAFGFGFSARDKAKASLKRRYLERTSANAVLRVMGDPERPEIASLKGTLFNALEEITRNRLSALEEMTA